MKWFCRHKWLTIMGLFIAFSVLFQTGRTFFFPQEHMIRQALHRAVKNKFPKAAQALKDRCGIKPFTEVKIPIDHFARNRVILVHGLDDPGIIWQNLAPVLLERGYSVLTMSYPNDQAINLSTRFFFEQMQQLAKKDPEPVVIVAHSMGGLVARDMLTRPGFDYPGAVAAQKVPAVKRLILVGTPNYGTQMARFRIFTEIRDQIFHLFRPDTHWLHCLLDGTGAAAIDLLPGSTFLTKLNLRPLPKDTQMHVIAGVISPWSGKGPVKNFLGDGLVSVGSASLQHVPLTMVKGNHFTMIRNVTTESTRVPPAITVILRLLKNSWMNLCPDNRRPEQF